MKSGDI